MSFIFYANTLTPGYSELVSQIIDLGILPMFSMKGATPVVSDLAQLIANSIPGNLTAQSR